MSPRPIRRIAIAGHGFEAWFTANHLLAGLGGKRVEVRICPVPGADRYDDLYSILPRGPGDGLAGIGLDSGLLARQCAASFSLGARFNGQARPYGSIGLDINGLPFHQHWLRGTHQGAEDYFSWSPATMAMEERRFAPPLAENAIGPLRHGMAQHVDIGRLAGLLRARALNSAADEWSGTIHSVARSEDGRVTYLLSDRGEKAEADLYIDCSGPLRILAGEPSTEAFAAAPGIGPFSCAGRRDPSVATPPPCHSIEGAAGGWVITVPGNGWTTRLDIRQDEEGENRLRPGHLPRPWVGNCVAIGQSAATFPPVEPLHARLLALSLKRLLDLLPDANCAEEETQEFNRLFENDALEIEDLCAAYERARLGGSPALLELRTAGTRLGRRISLFHRRGWVSPTDGEILGPQDWVGAFLLLGLVPERHDRLAERLPREKLDEYLVTLRARIRDTAAAFPPHEKFLAGVKPATAP